MLEDFTFLGTIKSLKSESFNWDTVPDVGGVYTVIIKKIGRPDYLLPWGTGGWFKGKNPNISEEKLNKKWIYFKSNENRIIYIGKAGGKKIIATLKSRIRTYIRFGKGDACGHWGGRYIWQIAGSDNLEVYWKKSNDPEGEEKRMLEIFKNIHGQKLPFANLKA